MKLFISDYDGTYLRNVVNQDEQLHQNAEQVRRWQAEGNLFGFSTGRILPLIEKEPPVQGLQTDVMIVANGALVLDAKGHTLFHQTFSAQVSKTLLHYLSEETDLNFICSDGRDGYLRAGVLTSPSMGEVFKSLQQQGYFQLTPADVLKQGVSQLSIIDLTPDLIEALVVKMETLFGEEVTIYPNRASIDLSPKNCSKAIGVKEAIKYLKLSSDQVICMGDSWNDLEMLQHYQGLTVPDAPAVLKEVAQAAIDSVASGLEWAKKEDYEV